MAMRKEWVEVKAEAHPEVVRGLMRYVELAYKRSESRGPAFSRLKAIAGETPQVSR